jgi:transcriptional regulator with XRE-family HTH domain
MSIQTSKELLAEIKKHMDIENIQVKDLAIRLNKSPQSVSQYFKNGNPSCNTLVDICNALGLQIEIKKNDITL